MDDTEQKALIFLKSIGFSDIKYEPNGNIPPDFVVNGCIAVEVRRLNQHSDTNGKLSGLETVTYPLIDGTQALLRSLGAPNNGVSWFVMLSFQRPIPNWKVVRSVMQIALQAVLDSPPETKQVDIKLFENL